MAYRIRWTTNVAGHEVTGFTLIEVEDFEAAMVTAQNLVDVDFFVPTRKYSASDHDVVGGSIASEGRFGDNLHDVLPDVEEWTFDHVSIVGIERAP